ncbi:MAG: phospho-sugar mutase [Deltaproteobacteria bacterium]|nr:phospho-sugar mutase [Deltaproteobacteria bacterium]
MSPAAPPPPAEGEGAPALAACCAALDALLQDRGAPPARRAALGAAVQAWLSAHPTDLPVVAGWVEAGEDNVLLDAFAQLLPLGTGGRRGAVGVGPNRFNLGTLLPAVAGHAALLRQRARGRPSVVLAWDIRTFNDLRGELARAGAAGQAHPLRGWRSEDFARAAAEVYAAAGLWVWMPPPSGPAGRSALSTPELSFAIRALQADGGLNLSASHNPPDDNGAKLYGPSGGQEVPPDDDLLLDLIAAAERAGPPARMPLPAAAEAGRVLRLPDEVIDAYHADLAKLLPIERPPARLGLRFTNLHGTARRTVLPALQAAGFRVRPVEAQLTYDGAFPTVPFRAPNPEVPACLDLAIAEAEAAGDALVIGCDPDADRVGLAARVHPDQTGAAAWRCFSGDELATLLVEAALRLHPPGPPPVLIQTEVTSSRGARLARARGARVIDHLLVGFKYIGAELEALDAQAHPALPGAGLADFALGVEESHGALLRPTKRDKDAADGALALCWLAEQEAAAGRSLLDTLDQIEATLGPTVNLLRNLNLRGVEGRARLRALGAGLRADPPTTLAGRRVLRWADRRDPSGPLGPLRGVGDAAARDVLCWWLEGNVRVLLRPSGTEPKSKLYLELSAPPGPGLSAQRAALRAEATALTAAVVAELLARIDLYLPRWALRCGDLLPVDAAATLAEAAERAVVDPEAEGALRAALAAAGPDASRLLCPGLLAAEDPRLRALGQRLDAGDIRATP